LEARSRLCHLARVDMSIDQNELLHRPRYSIREVVPLSGVPYTTGSAILFDEDGILVDVIDPRG
jgi:hypothetical protein